MARIAKVCKGCRKIYLTRNPGSEGCYVCLLNRITRGLLPQEGDFNAALLLSGETMDSQFDRLKSELGIQ